MSNKRIKLTSYTDPTSNFHSWPLLTQVKNANQELTQPEVVTRDIEDNQNNRSFPHIQPLPPLPQKHIATNTETALPRKTLLKPLLKNIAYANCKLSTST
jgi:hypothetical protein